jgi:hypothetical protein
VTEFKNFSLLVEDHLWNLFDDARSGIAAREDSRAFGAMIEKRITDVWPICQAIGAEFLPEPGRRTIYDFACRLEGSIIGFDVKTKDLDPGRYSDGGVCAVSNMLEFLVNDKGVFTVVEFGHTKTTPGKNLRKFDYIKVVPLHLLPKEIYRIENLGTGQVRLNKSIKEAFEDVDWNRSLNEFFEIFTDLAISHYEAVGRVAQHRADAMRAFEASGYQRFSL